MKMHGERDTFFRPLFGKQKRKSQPDSQDTVHQITQAITQRQSAYALEMELLVVYFHHMKFCPLDTCALPTQKR